MLVITLINKSDSPTITDIVTDCIDRLEYSAKIRIISMMPDITKFEEGH